MAVLKPMKIGRRLRGRRGTLGLCFVSGEGCAATDWRRRDTTLDRCLNLNISHLRVACAGFSASLFLPQSFAMRCTFSCRACPDKPTLFYPNLRRQRSHASARLALKTSAVGTPRRVRIAAGAAIRKPPRTPDVAGAAARKPRTNYATRFSPPQCENATQHVFSSWAPLLSIGRFLSYLERARVNVQQAIVGSDVSTLCRKEFA